jgi:hypothetical protein
MRVIGRTISDWERGMSATRMAMFIQGSFKTGNRTERAFTGGGMARFMTVNGKRDWSTGTEFGRGLTMNRTLENGRNRKPMGMESTLGKMEIGTKENGFSAWSKDRAQIFLQMEMSILASTKTGNRMGMGSICGRMEQVMSGTLRMAWSTEKDFGGSRRTRIRISMRANTEMTRNVARAFLRGPLETSIEGITETMSEMARVKWSGLMAQNMKGNGKTEFSMEWARWLFPMAKTKRGILSTIFSKELSQRD